jgi:hypothetical protein
MKYMCVFMVVAVLSLQIPHVVPPNTQDSISFFTGNDLLRHCEHSDASSSARCMGYIVGAVDMIGGLQSSSDRSGDEMWRFRSVCFPKQMDVNQVTDVVVKFLKENPEKRHQPASMLITIALIKAWGCPAK